MKILHIIELHLGGQLISQAQWHRWVASHLRSVVFVTPCEVPSLFRGSPIKSGSIQDISELLRGVNDIQF